MTESQVNTLPARVRDIRGATFGRLTVLSYAGSRIGKDKRYHYWACSCSCGKTAVVRGHCLSGGATRSCGCILREYNRSGVARLVHGMKDSPEYTTWCVMRQRCNDPNCRSFPDYGGRGITVCDTWDRSFVDFLADMGLRPSSGHSIDRIDRDGPYSRENCRWATRGEQANNKRNNRFLVHEGETLTAAEWSRRIGISGHTILKRIDVYGWSVAMSLTVPKWGRRSNE